MRLLLVTLLVGCGGPPLFGPPTESECPPTQTLTYENFAAKFMEDYCVECHDSKKFGDDRQGATSFHDFDSLFGIEAVSEHVDLTTASGPAATNTSMPPEGEPAPTVEERTQLGEWIACGMPREIVEVTRTIAPGQELVGTLTAASKSDGKLRLRAPAATLSWSLENAMVVVGQGENQTAVDFELEAPRAMPLELTLRNTGTSDLTVEVQLVLHGVLKFAWN